MTKSQLIDRVAHRQSLLAKRDVELAVRVMLEHMAACLAAGGRIEIRGFGSFSLHFRTARVARNPKTGNLWERLKNYETAVLRFAKHPDVAFTNNRAERDLRMAKVKQKVSGCFRTRKYAEAYCRISSYLQSMANQGYNPLVAIQIALAGRAVDNVGE